MGRRLLHVVRAVIEVIGRKRLRAEDRQQGHQAEMHGGGQRRKRREIRKAQPRRRKALSEHGVAHGRQEHQAQRQPVFADGVQRDLPELHDLPAVSHGIGRVEAVEDRVIHELRGKEDVAKPAAHRPEHAVRARREQAAQRKQQYRRNERIEHQQHELRLPELRGRGRMDDQLHKAQLRPKKQQEPPRPEFTFVHVCFPSGIK